MTRNIGEKTVFETVGAGSSRGTLAVPAVLGEANKDFLEPLRAYLERLGDP